MNSDQPIGRYICSVPLGGFRWEIWKHTDDAAKAVDGILPFCSFADPAAVRIVAGSFRMLVGMSFFFSGMPIILVLFIALIPIYVASSFIARKELTPGVAIGATLVGPSAMILGYIVSILFAVYVARLNVFYPIGLASVGLMASAISFTALLGFFKRFLQVRWIKALQVTIVTTILLIVISFFTYSYFGAWSPMYS